MFGAALLAPAGPLIAAAAARADAARETRGADLLFGSEGAPSTSLVDIRAPLLVTMYSPDSAHFTGCFAQAMNRYGAGTSWTGMRYTSTVGAHQVVTLGSLNVPNAGALYACCDIPTGGVVDAFNYSN